MDIITTIHERMKGLLPDLLGIRLLEASAEETIAERL